MNERLLLTAFVTAVRDSPKYVDFLLREALSDPTPPEHLSETLRIIADHAREGKLHQLRAPQGASPEIRALLTTARNLLG